MVRGVVRELRVDGRLVRVIRAEGDVRSCCRDHRIMHRLLLVHTEHCLLLRAARRGSTALGTRAPQVLAPRAIANHQADSLLDPHPVILLRNRLGHLVDPPVVDRMHRLGNLVLPLRITDNLLTLQHQLLRRRRAPRPIVLPSPALHEPIVRGGAAQPALLRTVGARGVPAVLKVVADLVETLLGDEVLALRGELAAVDYGVDEAVRVRAEGAAAGDAPDAFEAERVPDAGRGDVGFVD